MRLDGVTADADELGSLAAEVFVQFAKLCRFFGTTPSVVLRVEVENELRAEQIFSGNLSSGIVVNGQQRHGGAWFKHGVRILPHGHESEKWRYCSLLLHLKKFPPRSGWQRQVPSPGPIRSHCDSGLPRQSSPQARSLR